MLKCKKETYFGQKNKNLQRKFRFKNYICKLIKFKNGIKA